MRAERYLAGVLLALLLAACGASTPTLTPSPAPSPTTAPTETPYRRPTLPPTFTPPPGSPSPIAQITETTIFVSPLLGSAPPPPLALTLPEGWRFGYDTIVFQDLGTFTDVPLALYEGPVTGGQGVIVLLWNFPSFVPFSASNPARPNLWLDGLRLLRLLVFDASCNLGTAPQRAYSIGGREAVGTTFSAVDCDDAPNTRGWFAGLQVDGINYLFYVYVDPIEAMDGQAAFDLQAVLDSVEWLGTE
ncbi:MAG: hypothetical protein NZ750_12000 [Anaerolineae bacterium]|nr:hypothetical protein [Anaerolineae bacterium]MDW8173915.1 hypothetical protein [Anaerolineae bacterium]